MKDFDKNLLMEQNIRSVLRDGPRMTMAYNTWIEARDPRGLVLIGGLGCMGVGQMWFVEDERHKDYPGYEEAPELTYDNVNGFPSGLVKTEVQ
jgi:hypothetical protein